MRVSLHAISRWRERVAPESTADDFYIAGDILHSLKNSREVRLKNARERVSKLLKHGDKAKYHQHQDHVLVVAGGSILSVYFYDASRWEAVK